MSLFFSQVNVSYIIFSSPFGSKLLKWWDVSMRAKGSVGGGEAGTKAKTTPDAGEKSVIE